MPDAVLIAAAIVLTVAAGFSIAVGVYLTGIDKWREWRRKREEAKRPGYVQLQPTPDRPRLGIDKRGRRR